MLSDRMNEIKQKTGLTNASWAERSGVPISTVSRILSGATENPGFQTVLDLISAAEVPLSPSFRMALSSRTLPLRLPLRSCWPRRIAASPGWSGRSLSARAGCGSSPSSAPRLSPCSPFC